MKFISELKRRNVIRMAGLYLVGAWLITQVAATLLPVFEAPTWLMKTIVGILAIGFIPAVIFSWIFELTPEGLKRDAEVTPEQSIAPQTARKMERMIIVLFAIALSFFAFDKFVLAPKREAALVAITSKAITEKAVQQEKTENEKSIAVLAFDNMSADKDNEYFSDGVAEEILNSLAKVKDMKVAGRTSSFFYKGKNESLSTIGKTLGVAHVLEGSVRKQGNQLRITAQLIRVSDGFQLWSETFDGNDADIFALQENIARRVTGELKVALNSGQQDRLVNAGTRNPDAYELYLQASSTFNRRDQVHFAESIAALKQAIELDPKFARAWALLAEMETVSTSFGGVHTDVAHPKVLAAANAALALDPTLAEAWAAIGNSHTKQRGGLLASREAYDHALALDPDDVTTNFWAGLGLYMTGYKREGQARIEHALTLDPRLPNLVRWRAILYLYAGDDERARQYLERAQSDGLLIAGRELADLAYARGDIETARRLWPDGARSLLQALPAGSTEVLGAGLYGGDADARKRAVQVLDTFLAGNPGEVQGTFPLVLAKLDEPARALQVWRENGISDPSDISVRMWSPAGKPIRQLPEFSTFLREYGYYDLWDKYGPPDQCRRAANGDYHCD